MHDLSTFFTLLPNGGSLKQGSFGVEDQFFYRWASDGQEITAAVAYFQYQFAILAVATTRPEWLKLLGQSLGKGYRSIIVPFGGLDLAICSETSSVYQRD